MKLENSPVWNASFLMMTDKQNFLFWRTVQTDILNKG